MTSIGGEREEGERGGERPTHLAFGTKVPIPEHILTSRKSARSTAMPTSRQTAVSVKAAGGKRDIEELEIQTKRVELLSGDKQTNTRGQSNSIHPLSTEAEMEDRAAVEKNRVERHDVLHTHHHDDIDHRDDVEDADHHDDMEEESVVEILKEVEIERREELSESRGQHSDNETTYLYSSHPKSASNLMV